VGVECGSLRRPRSGSLHPDGFLSRGLRTQNHPIGGLGARPTLTKHLAIIDWHSGGLQIIDTSDPTNPVQAGFCVSDPSASVANEDPGHSQQE
jgi:hypothetical protein